MPFPAPVVQGWSPAPDETDHEGEGAMAKEIVWTRDPADGSYTATIDGEVVGSVYHGGVSGYPWTAYPKGGRSTDCTTLGSGKAHVERANGIAPKPVDTTKSEAAAKRRTEKMLADSRRRQQFTDVMALRRVAHMERVRGTINADQIGLLLVLADQIEHEATKGQKEQSDAS